ncbi:MAG: efflux RND transporter periplasmic adaptor subunit [Candidatus Latescibacteria bacterium]|nr:efflux RND transporter periplasmic adaptor subunit [bacterium]MCB9517150.1 efflux RND transporter periplasmic adaptor subunit [Candidatus Latescibacterota bacterium]
MRPTSRLRLLLPLLLLAACERGHGVDEHLAAAHAEEAHDHDHDHDDELSDLDRPVDALFAARCEHDLAAHACAECRYEVGVARVTPVLISDGLIATATVDTRAVAEAVDLPGEIRFDEHRIAHLTPLVAGVVSAVQVDLGQPVKAGEPLLVLQSAALAEAQAAYLDALAAEPLAARAHERLSALRDAAVASEREALEAAQQLEAARIRREACRQRLLALGVAAGEIEALIQGDAARADGRLLLRAPFAGEVLGLHAVRGEPVEPGADLLLLGDTETLWVWVDVYEGQLARLEALRRAGPLPVEVIVAAYPDRVFPGTLDLLGRSMDEATRTVKSRVLLPNPDGLLRPGMFARVRVELPGDERALAVPADALLADAGREFVFVHHEGEYFVRRPVTSGRRLGGHVEIVEGLAAGQTVAGQGAFLLKSDVLRSKMGAGCAD